MSRRKFSWSELPPELLFDIANRLETREDILLFRTACKSWYQSTSTSLFFGKNILSPFLPYKFSTPAKNILSKNASFLPGNSLILVASSVYLIESPVNSKYPPWIVSVEELNPGKLYLRKPLSRIAIEKLPENFPKVVDLSKFQVWEIGKLYTLRFADNFDDMFKWKGWYHFIHKVVLYKGLERETGNGTPNGTDDPYSGLNISNNTTIKRDDYFAIVLYDNGYLVSIRLKDENSIHLVSNGMRKFDDIANSSGGMIFAVDRKGRLYYLQDDMTLIRLSKMDGESLGSGVGGDRKKRLVASCNELYVIYRDYYNRKIDFRVYKFNKEELKWEEIEGIGDERILFVTYDGSFVAYTMDFPGWKGNCIVFYRGCFPSYTNGASADPDYEIAAFYFDTRKCLPLESYPGYADVFKSPPSWLLGSASSDFSICDGVDEHQQGDSLNPPVTQTIVDVGIFSSIMRAAKEIQVVQPKIKRCMSRDPDASTSSDSPQDSDACSSAKRLRGSDACFGHAQQIQSPVIIDVDSVPHDTPVKNAESGASPGKFQGVDVCSDLIPTLRNIWNKHGDITQGHVMHSKGFLSWALESLAKMVVVLQRDSGRSLSDSEAEFVGSTLLDLQRMNFKVDWLIPFVESALAYHRSKEQKSKLLEKLQKLDEILLEHDKLIQELCPLLLDEEET